MSVLTIPNTFVTATTINAAPFNGNFAAVATAVNNTDNTNIGAAGIFASQLLPTTGAQATFGGAQAYTFPGALAITGALSGVTTLAIGGALSGVTSLAMGGALTGATTGAFSGAVTTASLTATGNVAAVGGGVLAYPSVFSSPGGAAGDAVFQRSVGTGALFLGGATVAGEIDWAIGVGGGFSFRRSDNGNYAPLLIGQGGSGVANGGYAPPVYTATGTALASSTHIATGSTTITFTAAQSSATATVNLTGAAVMTNGTSYIALTQISDYISGSIGSAALFLIVTRVSGSQFTIVGNASSAITLSFTATWSVIGA